MNARGKETEGENGGTVKIKINGINIGIRVTNLQ
jgi:hypothetical protein